MTTWNSGGYSIRFGGAPRRGQAGGAGGRRSRGSRRWRAEGDRLRLAGDVAGRTRPTARQMRAMVADPELVRAADALIAGRPAEAEAGLRAVLARRPDAPLALWMLAEAVSRGGRNPEAEALLARCLELAPGFTDARYAYAMVLNWRHRTEETLPRPTGCWPPTLPIRSTDTCGPRRSCAWARTRRPPKPMPRSWRPTRTSALPWMSYGHALKTVGRQAEAVAAYRRAWRWTRAGRGLVEPGQPQDRGLRRRRLAAMRPRWRAATLRRRPAAAALRARQGARGRRPLTPRPSPSTPGQRLQRARLSYDPTRPAARCGGPRRCSNARSSPRTPGRVSRTGPDLHRRPAALRLDADRADPGQPQPGRGHPRAAAHPGAGGAAGRRAAQGVEGAYPDILAALSPQEIATWARSTWRGPSGAQAGPAALHRQAAEQLRPRGLIQLILPNAKIIDARRHPLGCCFSGFKQHFATRPAFSYDLTDIGRYYRDYVELMAHFDAVLPGRVHG
jgi:hypothetical protein